VAKLCEYACGGLEKIAGRIDDSGGELTLLCGAAEDLHLRACMVAPGDELQLARTLYALATTGDLDLFDDALARYAVPLGERGSAEFRRLAEVDWAMLEPTSRSASATDRYLDGTYRVRRVIEQLALADRDVNRIVQIHGDGLRHDHDFARAAEALASIGELDEAAKIAQRGLERFPTRSDFRDHVLAATIARGDYEAAVELAWRQLVRRFDPADYDRLRACAEQLDDWESWRMQALSAARAAGTGDVSRSARLLLHEGDIDGAWREARSGPCDDNVLTQLADLRASTHAADAAEIHLERAQRPIRWANSREYDHVVAHLTRADALLATPAQRRRFDDVVTSIRAANERRPAMLRRLDARGW
jgi:tetratricopeptide (TPR) repeat protein